MMASLWQKIQGWVVLSVCLVGLAWTNPAYAAASTAAAGSLSDFENGTMIGEDLSGKNFAGAQFANVKLDNAKLDKTNLIGAVFSTSTLRGTSFKGADMTQIIFDQVRLINVDFSDAVLEDGLLLRAEFNNIKADGADFTGTILSTLQTKQLCANVSGTNSKTGVDTRESLGCR
jgi:uncharacterized protein YjbI with pentapeptide repeats